MDEIIDIASGKAWFFDYDNEEFERVRNICLSDKDNWLRDNYTPENLKISDHKFFCIAYDKNGAPLAMAGGKEYNKNVMRLLNRWYFFPRKMSSLCAATFYPKHYMISMSECLAFVFKNFDHKLFFVSMQQRRSKRVGQQLWWKAAYAFVKTWDKKMRWQNYDKGLVQVANCEETSCYQNIMYYTRKNYTFEDWNPNIMSYNEHTLRMRYESSL